MMVRFNDHPDARQYLARFPNVVRACGGDAFAPASPSVVNRFAVAQAAVRWATT
jgi:hypothetical protein